MGRGNRGKKKTKNIDVAELLEESNKNQSSEVLGGFSYSQCVTNPKKKNKKKKSDLSLNSGVDVDLNKDFNENLREDFNQEDFNNNIEEVNDIVSETPTQKINFFNKHDEELELYEKQMLVNMFVNRYWNRICVCERVEDIILENENDNDSDEYFNDDF